MMRSTSSTSSTSTRNLDRESTDQHHDKNTDDCNLGGSDSILDLNEIDFESLRRVFGSASPDDLSHLKAHELRELWLKKTADASETTTTPSKRKKNKQAKIPRFLLRPDEKDHVAPHAVALQLLLRHRNGRNPTHGDGLYRTVASSDDDEGSEQSHHRHSKIHPSRTNNNDNLLQGTAMVLLLILVAFIALTCQFILEVLGGAGAIWGCSEIVTLRKGGTSDPSWRFFTFFALVVGTLCLLRFLLVHPFFAGATDPTFAEKYKLCDLLRHSRQKGNVRLFFELATLVARDPVLFLHPTKGPTLSSCCGCYCLCYGNQWSSFRNEEDGNTNHDVEDNSTHRHSPASLGKPSPQRSTWDISNDDDDDDDEDVDAYNTAADP